MDMAAMKKMMETTSEEDRKKGMEEWGKWFKEHGSAFADMGGPTGKNTELSSSGAAQKSNDLGGYSVVQADSMDAAVELLKSNPHFQMPGAVMDIAEIMPMA